VLLALLPGKKDKKKKKGGRAPPVQLEEQAADGGARADGAAAGGEPDGAAQSVAWALRSWAQRAPGRALGASRPANPVPPATAEAPELGSAGARGDAEAAAAPDLARAAEGPAAEPAFAGAPAVCAPAPCAPLRSWLQAGRWPQGGGRRRRAAARSPSAASRRWASRCQRRAPGTAAGRPQPQVRPRLGLRSHARGPPAPGPGATARPAE